MAALVELSRVAKLVRDNEDRHTVREVKDTVILCSCGAWFADFDGYGGHRIAVLDTVLETLAARRMRRNVLDHDTLSGIARAYRDADPGKRTAAVADLLGLSVRSAGS